MHNSADIPNIIQSEIYPDETVLWTYKPSWYHAINLELNRLIFFSLMVITILFVNSYFVIIQDKDNTFNKILSIFFYIDIIIHFIYFIIIYIWKSKSKYILTNKRAVFINRFSQKSILFKKHTDITVIKQKNNMGYVVFGSVSYFNRNRFEFIPDIDHVEKLIYNIQNNHQ